MDQLGIPRDYVTTGSLALMGFVVFLHAYSMAISSIPSCQNFILETSSKR